MQRFRRWRAVKPVTELLQDYVAKVRKIPRSDTAARTREFHSAAGKMLAIYRQGLVLDDPRAGIFSDYWRLVFEGALQEKDVEAAARALTVYRQSFGTRPDMKNRIDLMAKRVPVIADNIEQFSGKLNITADEFKKLMTAETRAKIESVIASLEQTTRSMDALVKDVNLAANDIKTVVLSEDGDLSKSMGEIRYIVGSVSRHIDSINQNMDGAARNMYEFSR
jgi:hypothetical protein